MSVDFYASGGLSSRDTTSRLVVRRQKRNNAATTTAPAKANELSLGVLRKNNKLTLLKYGNIFIIGYSCLMVDVYFVHWIFSVVSVCCYLFFIRIAVE